MLVASFFVYPFEYASLVAEGLGFANHRCYRQTSDEGLFGGFPPSLEDQGKVMKRESGGANPRIFGIPANFFDEFIEANRNL